MAPKTAMNLKLWVVLAVALACASVSHGLDDPATITAKALQCFNNRFIYSSCNEDYRLTMAGEINVPPEYTDEYCNGPCMTETHLVLNCVDNILLHFAFYNRATVQDVRDTIKAACSDSKERGHFSVAEHMAAEESAANKAGPIFIGVSGLILAQILFN
uniref:DUF7731 domain-containing protein n=1 Tax=Kalanchoe fedtschenkoi TaxID=63787 RepID=A0A7N0U3X1_KALFE